MATPDRLAPSRRLQSAALAERRRLERRLERAEQRLASLRSELQAVEDEAGELRRQLDVVGRLSGDIPEHRRPSLRAVSVAGSPTALGEPAPLGVLKGADIRTVAVRILATSERPADPIHYGDWLALVREAGYGISGRDPLATFLTQITRSPVVQHAGAPGMYVLDLGAPARLRDRLRALHEELVQLREGQQTLEDIATVRERRLELSAEYDRVEQALAEAVESLGLADGSSAPSP